MQRTPKSTTASAVVNSVRDLLPPSKTTACHRCRKKKIKCSDGPPCPNCIQAGVGTECSYPLRTTSVKVPQRFIDELLEEIDRLRRANLKLQLERTSKADGAGSESSQQAAPTPPNPQPGAVSSLAAVSEIDAEERDRDSVSPTFNYGPWFDSRNLFQDPIFIGETADAAFATRFRQVISIPNAPEPFHLLRLNYAANETLMTLVGANTPWPSHQRSRFLIEGALKYLGRCHYLVHRDKITEGLSHMAADSSWGGPALRSKCWVLFALGELYVTKFTTSSTSYPGLEYFAQASKLLGFLDERPGLDSIETLLLLSLYSLALNRRYSAYTLVGTAMRSAIVMGLHLDVPESQLPDQFARDHRKRLFWTAYMFDRMWGAHLNLPAAIQDDEIEVGLPFQEGAGADAIPLQESTADHAFLTASIKLVGRLTSVIGSVYSNRRNRQDVHLSVRVQRALNDLQNWVDQLPTHLQLDHSVEGRNPVHVVSLHLSFYQCVILTTRPILLHALRVNVAAAQASTPSSSMHVPVSASDLSEACARCARHSARLLTQSWIEGTFVTFDCFFTRYLFSSLTILAISSMLGGRDSVADRESFEEAVSLLRQLKDAGNCVAQEYFHHVEAMKTAIAEYVGKFSDNSEVTEVPSGVGFGQLLPALAEPIPHDLATAGMPWTEPSLQKLLSQSALDMQFLEAAARDGYSERLL